MSELSGPMGLWKFPLLAILLKLIGKGDSSKSRGTTQRPSRQSFIPKTVAENEERWEMVRDKKGRLVEIVVHRRVEKA